MGRKIVRILVVGVLIVTGAFALNEAGDRSASAANHAPAATRLRSARGLGVSITLTDYSAHQRLACGGTYVIQSWVSIKVHASARTSGTARLVFLTNENGLKYWHAKAFTVYLKNGGTVIGRSDQWLEAGGDSNTYTFRVELYRQSDREHKPQASTRCKVTVSKGH
jgi:hypothetical protein